MIYIYNNFKGKEGKMKTPKGLTNKITLDNGVLTKTSNKSVDYFLNRQNESKLYDFFSTLDAQKSIIIQPLN
jgi:hypothetical protein